MSAPTVQLVGMFDSPYVRRVALSLAQLEVPFEHLAWSVGKDQLLIRELNPVGRVPVVVLPGGEVLIESSIILDHFDEQAGPERRLLPFAGTPRRAVQDWLALTIGTLDKGIQIVYDKVFKPAEKLHEPWLQRCREQTHGALAELDRRCAGRAQAEWLVGTSISQADITLAAFITYLRDAAGFELSAYPALRARLDRLEALPLFAQYYVPFDAPVPA